jgi:hypothetical protein
MMWELKNIQGQCSGAAKKLEYFRNSTYEHKM